MADLNTKLFLKINGLVGKNKFLDSFGRAGAEWVIVAMVGWYVASDLVDRLPSKRFAFWPIAFFAAFWTVGWLVNLLIGMSVRERRPSTVLKDVKLLFQPLTNWKSFPSDHVMSAFLLFFMAISFQLPGSSARLVMALWVAWGRIYAGVHYPLDILGGISVAAFCALLSSYIFITLL